MMMHSVLIPHDERCNALEYTTAADYVPSYWDGPQVGKRLIEAFKTLALMPGLRLPNKSGYWPPYAYEWGDLLAQEEADTDVRESIAADLNRVRILPSANDIGRMEAAIVWPARYLSMRPIVMRIVHSVAFGRARDVESDRIARRIRRHPAQVRRIRHVDVSDRQLGHWNAVVQILAIHTIKCITLLYSAGRTND